jgi:hypothetical protein
MILALQARKQLILTPPKRQDAPEMAFPALLCGPSSIGEDLFPFNTGALTVPQAAGRTAARTHGTPALKAGCGHGWPPSKNRHALLRY